MAKQIPEAVKKEIQAAYSQYLDNKGFKARYGQRLMIAEIVKGLFGVDSEGSAISVVEAGTGTGKTIAYLLAAIPVARHLKKKLVISTATVALQEQIVSKDLPELAAHSGLEFSFALVKGRGRYLCLSKLDLLLNNHQQNNPTQGLYEDELALRLDDDGYEFYQELGESYARGDWDGDRDSWPTEIDNQDWQLITTDHRQCTNRRCSHFSGCCFFRSRQGVDQATCIVANHDLVLSDLALGGGAILPPPEETIYIFDEGHHLADKALQHFSHRVRLKSTQSWLKQLSKGLSKMLKDLGNPESLARTLEPVATLSENISRIQGDLIPLIDELQAQVSEQRSDRAYYRFVEGVVPDSVRDFAVQLAGSYGRLFSVLDSASETLKEAIDEPLLGVSREGAELWYPTLGRFLTRTEGSWALWRDYAEAGVSAGAPQARWLTSISGLDGEDTELSSSPILAADTLKKHLWESCSGAVVTSATLTALGVFQRLIMRTGLPEHARFCKVPSPFDYSAATLNIPALKASPAEV
ncbi:MAG: DEAD/DEAH box helicase, partial [Motiliproteus sp.]